MRVVRHPLVARDLAALVDHIIEVTGGNFAAAERRLDEIDALVSDIIVNPMSGMRLGLPLEGWLVRHGGRGHRITIVFRPDPEADCLFVALVAFSGRDWMTKWEDRKAIRY